MLQALQKEMFSPVYFLQGEEPYYIDAITEYIENHILQPTEKSFNLTVVYGKECNMATLLTQARRFPMGSTKQVVIVKEAQEMADLKNTTGQQLLLNYLAHIQPATLLVFAHKYKAIDGRSAFSKTLEKKTVLVNCKKLYDQQLPTFIKSFAKRLELSITEKAVWMIQEFIGNDLNSITNELHKLRINFTAGSTITESIVETYVGLHRPFNVFELQKAIMQKDYAKSYQIISICSLNAKEHAALPIVTILYNFFSKLLILHQTKEKTPTKMAQQIEINPYFLQGYLDATKKYHLHQILQNITYLHEADLQLKGINCNINDYQIMKELIFKLMNESKAH
ncbi:DNA polymerase III subunit delta [Cardinium endosymbiont of Tipula unca]|uniref:DNA polymerase III subunit delta n=1 Tax=Cardinium endosymbiont of Tipula unca TaxID=3066216 RepID=UPI0030D46EF0